MSPALFPRQQNVPNNNNNNNNGGEEVFVDHDNDWWFSPTAVIVKWSIFGAFVLILTVWFVGGYIHARRRIKKGLPPLRYHRFLAPAEYRPQPQGPQLYADFYRLEDRTYHVPPPPQAPNNPNAQIPPAYPADHKVDPEQSYDVPPPGPPPGQSQAELPPRQPNKAAGIMNRINPFHK